jgi:hypothetical protein
VRKRWAHARQQSWLAVPANGGDIEWQSWLGACYKVAMARVRFGRGWMVGLGAALALACTTPTLPLPPPAAPVISNGTEPDTFRLSSVNGAEPNALIVIVNRNEDLPRNKRVSGTIADPSGSWDVIVTAKVGDVLDVSQEAGSTRSPGTTVTVR